MKETLELNITGIKCDVCDYRDDTVEFKDYPNWLNKPCPKCGNNLLALKDYESCLRIMSGAKIVNKIGSVLKWINPFFYYRKIYGDQRKEVTLYQKTFKHNKK